MKIRVLVLLVLLFPFVSFAKNICKKCKYENEDYDRYCLNCSEELREITPEEKKKLDQYDSINAKRADEERRLKLEKEIRKKEEEKKKEKSLIEEVASSDKTASIPILINGKSVVRGMRKPELRRRFEYSSSSYPYAGDVWRLTSSFQTTYFYFTGEILTKYITTINYDYFIKREFPLEINDIKKGQSEDEIKSLWGEPDIKYEENSPVSFTYKLVYYLNEPSTDLVWKDRAYSSGTASRETRLSGTGTRLENCLMKTGKTAELFF